MRVRNKDPVKAVAVLGVEAVDDVAALARVDHVKDALVVVWGIVLYSERARVSTGMPVR